MAEEYILRSIAIAKLTALEVTDPFATIANAKRVLADMAAADVAKVVHGKWGDNGIAGSMRSELGERIFQEIGEDGVLEQLASALYYMSSTVQLMKCPRSLKEKLRPMLADEWADVLMSAGVLGIEPNPDACGGKLISWAKAIGIEVGDEGTKGSPGALGIDP